MRLSRIAVGIVGGKTDDELDLAGVK